MDTFLCTMPTVSVTFSNYATLINIHTSYSLGSCLKIIAFFRTKQENSLDRSAVLDQNYLYYLKYLWLSQNTYNLLKIHI